jgi:hypothetical protein
MIFNFAYGRIAVFLSHRLIQTQDRGGALGVSLSYVSPALLVVCVASRLNIISFIGKAWPLYIKVTYSIVHASTIYES